MGNALWMDWKEKQNAEGGPNSDTPAPAPKVSKSQKKRKKVQTAHDLTEGPHGPSDPTD